MPRVVPKETTRGSQKWLQRLVTEYRSTLDREIVVASNGAIRGPIDWRSPLRSDEYAEYSDQAFLDRLGVRLVKRPLASFWPTNGPNWDGLGVAEDGAVVLVEAKAHASEPESQCTAAAEESLTRIRQSLGEVQRHFGVDRSYDWTRRYYQYANRLAHLHLLRELNDIPTWLVFLYFVGDTEMKGPSRPEGWAPILRGIHDALGLRTDASPFVVDAYVDVRRLASPSFTLPVASDDREGERKLLASGRLRNETGGRLA